MKRSNNYLKILFAFTLVNLIILAIRNMIVGNDFYSFLRSNLYIGSMPVIIIAYLLYTYNDRINKYVFWIGTFLWFIFYPNAPYMISDLIHNSQDPAMSLRPNLIKYDTLIIFSLSMLSIFYGFLSLKFMFQVFKNRYGKYFAHTAIQFTILISCLGFYMGRELLSSLNLGNGYLYSWEIFLEPMHIIKVTWNALWPVHKNWPAYAMMGLFGAVQYLLLGIFYFVNDIEAAPKKIEID